MAEEKSSDSLADLAAFTPETFEPHVGDQFSVRLDDATVELELEEVTRYPQIAEAEKDQDPRPREPFSLLFRGGHETVLQSQAHAVEHQKLKAFEVFLNPVVVSAECPAEKHPDGRFYEAVFG